MPGTITQHNPPTEVIPLSENIIVALLGLLELGAGR